MVLLLTVMGAVAVTLLLYDFAVSVAVPRATPVNSPELLIVAMLWLEEVHDTCDVTSPVVLLPKVAVAVNCCVPCGFTHALPGESEIETTASDAGKKPPQLLSNIAITIGAANLLKYLKRLMCFDVSPLPFRYANIIMMLGLGNVSCE